MDRFLAGRDVEKVILSIGEKEAVFNNIINIVINTEIATQNGSASSEIEIIMEEFVDEEFTCTSLYLMEQVGRPISEYKLIINLHDFKLVFSQLSFLSTQQIYDADSLINKTIIKANHFSKES